MATLFAAHCLEQLALEKESESAWTRESFWQFIENLGDSQKQVLGLLVEKHKAADEQLRKLLKLDSNQALAGVLSGISKQAGILNIPARSVYTVEDERKDGWLSKSYVAANDFMRIAHEMNWPEVKPLPSIPSPSPIVPTLEDFGSRLHPAPGSFLKAKPRR